MRQIPFFFFCLLLGTWFSISQKPKRPEEVTQSPKEEVILMKEPLKGIESCLYEWQLNVIFPQFLWVDGTDKSHLSWLFSADGYLEETAVFDVKLYTILLKDDLRYTEGICLVLSAWRMQLTVNLVKQKIMCSGGEIVHRSVDMFYLYISMNRDHRITESQNHSIIEWVVLEGHLPQ